MWYCCPRWVRSPLFLSTHIDSYGNDLGRPLGAFNYFYFIPVVVNELTINMMYTWRNVVRLRFSKNEVYGEVFFWRIMLYFLFTYDGYVFQYVKKILLTFRSLLRGGLLWVSIALPFGGPYHHVRRVVSVLHFDFDSVTANLIGDVDSLWSHLTCKWG